MNIRWLFPALILGWTVEAGATSQDEPDTNPTPPAIETENTDEPEDGIQTNVVDSAPPANEIQPTEKKPWTREMILPRGHKYRYVTVHNKGAFVMRFKVNGIREIEICPPPLDASDTARGVYESTEPCGHELRDASYSDWSPKFAAGKHKTIDMKKKYKKKNLGVLDSSSVNVEVEISGAKELVFGGVEPTYSRKFVFTKRASDKIEFVVTGAINNVTIKKK